MSYLTGSQKLARAAKVRDRSLIVGRGRGGGLQNGKVGQVNFYPYERREGGGRTSFS